LAEVASFSWTFLGGLLPLPFCLLIHFPG
jgi:hypothetical protein